MKLHLTLFILLQGLITSKAAIAAPLANECRPSAQQTTALLKGFKEGTQYNPVLWSCRLPGGQQDLIALRSFQIGNVKSLLFVDQQTLQSNVLPQQCFESCHAISNEDLLSNDSIYSRALLNSTQEPFPRHGDGLRHQIGVQKKVYLTIDLCPSHKALDRDLFEKLQESSETVPVSIAISGLWLLNHLEDFKYLRDLESKNKIQMTWINHTYTHPYKRALPEEKNFLLMEGISLQNEIFKNEKLLLSYGIAPSIFVRFPGLVSDEKIVLQIRSWGLIPISSDAWLANDQIPKIGSIILIHGNGNERQGIDDFFRLWDSWSELKSLLSNLSSAFF